MNKEVLLSFRAALEEYQSQAQELFAAAQSANEEAEWRFKWLHPRFRDRPVTDVRDAALALADAQLVVALSYGFESWAGLAEFSAAVNHDGPVARFESAVEAVISGDVSALHSMLCDNPELARARSTRRHHATLLHYVGANGVEDVRQKTPKNAVEVAKTLLDAGADVDAPADMYDGQWTTLGLLASSCHPAEAGVQTALAETLLDYGASLAGPNGDYASAIVTALAFGYLAIAEALARRGEAPHDLATVAGLGRLEDAARLLPIADTQSRHIGFALAAQNGHAAVVRLMLDAGEDPNRYNPEGFHSHSTPLHQAVWSDQIDVVRLLVERGARLDMRDTIYRGTPLGWAKYGKRDAIAEYLAERGAPAD